MTAKTLSKSDFQLASTCEQKLIYKKRGYPTAGDSDGYMQMLSEGGYVVGKMATLLYEDGREISAETTEDCVNQTRDWLAHTAQGILFEAAILSNQKLVRIDILEKTGNRLHLIEVKAKSHDSDDVKESAKKLKKYIDDVAYQFLVLKEAYPDFEIECSLLMPDKSKATSIDGLAGWFRVLPNQKSTNETDLEIEELPARQRPTFRRPQVEFIYENDPNRDTYIQRLRDEGILSTLEITLKVRERQVEIAAMADRFLEILNQETIGKAAPLCKACKACEFNPSNATPNGYLECWDDLGKTTPHIFDLYYGGSIGHHTKGYYLDQLIHEKKVSLFDIDFEKLKNSEGVYSSRGERQILQITQTRQNQEWLSPELNAQMQNWNYPLHFIDFETYTGAIPFHQGMRPYETIAFQWSCHTITKKGAAPIHSQWIHTGSEFPDPNEYPNIEFARTLMQQIGNEGTPFMWASHENTVLRSILERMEAQSHPDLALRKWLTGMTHFASKTKDRSRDRKGRLVDMNKLTAQYYFHPDMKGRTSIKKVLPAVWSAHRYLHEVIAFRDYAPTEFEQGLIDPYETLVAVNPGPDWKDAEEVIRGGTAAMRAYQRIRFDHALNDTDRQELRNQLLQYCKLDTMAMVIIAHHWGLK